MIFKKRAFIFLNLNKIKLLHKKVYLKLLNLKEVKNALLRYNTNTIVMNPDFLTNRTAVLLFDEIIIEIIYIIII